MKALVEAQHIAKSFGATQALRGVSFSFYAGEIFALVGANGAGKSTLIKIICGYYEDFEGEILIDGQPARFHSPQDAFGKGIRTVHQIINQGVIPTMSVAENLALHELLDPASGMRYRRAYIRQRAQEIAAPMELQFKDWDQPVSDLSQSDRQLISIARSLVGQPKLLILDEPTSSISTREAERLFQKLEQLRQTGVAIVYVSHRLHEVERLADRAGVVRDGSKSAELTRPILSQDLVRAMVGEIEQDAAASTRRRSQRAPRLELRNLVVQAGAPPLNLDLHAGEIAGITGLIGAGKSELAEVLYGLREPISGTIRLDGEPLQLTSVAAAIRQGIHLVPEDRSNRAVIPNFSVCQNLSLPFLRDFSWSALMQPRREQQEAERLVHDLGVKCAGIQALITSLSGGNQQKVIVARWLQKKFRVLVLDEPFQGVDIKSRHDIIQYLREQLRDEVVLVLAADLDEILEVADRVLVLNHGRLMGEQPRDQLERPQLLDWISATPTGAHV
jgi:simple sugar transport system ATP-binding protein